MSSRASLLILVGGVLIAVIVAAVVWIRYGDGESESDSPQSTDVIVDEVLDARQRELIAAAVPNPQCQHSLAEHPGGDVRALTVIRLEETCLTTTIEYVPADRVDARREQLAADPAVVAAAEVPLPRPLAPDELRTEQWALDAIGADGTDPLPWPAGDGVVVAVLDSGIDAQHADLVGAVAGRRSFPGEDVENLDSDGHGTAVAGIVAARAGNGGVVGVAPSATLLDVPIAMSDDINAGAGDWPTGLIWAVDQGAAVVNMSFGVPLDAYSPDAIEVVTTATEYAQHHDVVLVAAAGNCGPESDCEDREVEIPAALPGVVAVGAVDSDLELAGFSSRTRVVDVVAPGVDIETTAPGGGHEPFDGTSAASPHVAGAIAVARSGRSAPAGQVVDALYATAAPLESAASQEGAAPG